MRCFKNTIIVCVIWLASGICAHGQKFHLDFELGVQHNHMNELRDDLYNKEYYLPFEVKILADYPPFLSYYGGMEYVVSKRIGLGLGLSHHSTGSRISREDYSGIYLYDTRVSSLNPDLFVVILIHEFDKFLMNFRFNTGLSLNKFSYEEHNDIYDYSLEKSSDTFESGNIFVRPDFQLIFPVKKLRLTSSIGYQLDVYLQDLHILDHRYQYPNFGNGETASVNWSGLYISIGIGYSFGGQKEK